MRTFQEIAESMQGAKAPLLAPAEMVGELAQAMHRLEYNLAVQLAFMRVGSTPTGIDQRILINTWLNNLRADLPQMMGCHNNE